MSRKIYMLYALQDLHRTLLDTCGVSCEICTSCLLDSLSKIVLEVFVVNSDCPGKLRTLEEEQAYKWLMQHHICEPTLAFLLCRDDLVLAEAIPVGPGKVFQLVCSSESWHGILSL